MYLIPGVCFARLAIQTGKKGVMCRLLRTNSPSQMPLLARLLSTCAAAIAKSRTANGDTVSAMRWVAHNGLLASTSLLRVCPSVQPLPVACWSLSALSALDSSNAKIVQSTSSRMHVHQAQVIIQIRLFCAAMVFAFSWHCCQKQSGNRDCTIFVSRAAAEQT